jgi:hypothetical protein
LIAADRAKASVQPGPDRSECEAILSNHAIGVAGFVESDLALEDFAGLLREGDWRVDPGRYAVRLSSILGDCKFEPCDGGFILDDGIDAEDPLPMMRLLSTFLAARGIRHGFEAYGGDGELILELSGGPPV